MNRVTCKGQHAGINMQEYACRGMSTCKGQCAGVNMQGSTCKN